MCYSVFNTCCWICLTSSVVVAFLLFFFLFRLLFFAIVVLLRRPWITLWAKRSSGSSGQREGSQLLEIAIPMLMLFPNALAFFSNLRSDGMQLLLSLVMVRFLLFLLRSRRRHR